MTNNQLKTGECEACETKEVKLTLRNGNTWMCDKCWAEEVVAIEAANNNTNAFVAQARKQDEKIEVIADIYNAATVAAVELRAAIENDPSISAENKHLAFYEACAQRFLHMKQVVSDDRKTLNQHENELRMWQIEGQRAGAGVREEQRAKYKELDVNYQPTKPKSVKPKSAPPVKTKTAKFDKAAVNAAAAKYGVSALIIRSIQVSRNLSPEDAAKEYLAGIEKAAK